MVHKGGGEGQIFQKICPPGLRMTPNHKSQPTIFDANRTSDNHTKPRIDRQNKQFVKLKLNFYD